MSGPSFTECERLPSVNDFSWLPPTEESVLGGNPHLSSPRHDRLVGGIDPYTKTTPIQGPNTVLWVSALRVRIYAYTVYGYRTDTSNSSLNF